MVQKLITIKKRGGGTRKQLVQVLKSGKFKFIKMGSKARKVGKSIKSKAKRRSTSRNTNKKPKGSHRSVQKLSLYPKKSAKEIGIKAAIGTAIGLGIRLGTMFINDRNVRELGSRAANAGASYGGGGTGNLIYNAVDAGLSRLIAQRMGGGNGGGVTVPNPLVIGGA